MRLHPRARTLLAWLLWLATMACCAAGLVVTLFVTRPLTAGVLVEGAAFALAFPLGYATIGLVMALRRPANPIGWLFAAAGLAWSVTIPFDPWVTQLILDHRPLPLAAQVGALVGEFNWSPAIAFGITLPALLVPDGRLRSPRWRPVVAAAVAGPVLGMLGSSFLPGKLEETVVPIDNPFGRTGVVARWRRWSASPAWGCGSSACRPPWSRWCCASGPPAGPSASSCAGSWPGPPAPWPGWWSGSPAWS